MATHKKQHTIPRSYLAAWVDPVTPYGQTASIWRISKDQSVKRRRAPENSFTESDRYTIWMKDGTRNLTVENNLGRIENDFQGVLRSIRRREKLSVLQRAKLCAFTAAMLGRSKKQGDHIKSQWTAQLEKVKRMEDRLEGVKRSLSEELEETNKSSHAHHVLNTIKIAGPILFSMSFTIITTDDPNGFITSDAPAVMYNPKAHTMPPFHRNPGFVQADIEIGLPLSPRELALFCHKPLTMLYTPMPLQIVDEINRTTFGYSEAEFVSWKGTTK